MRRSTSKSMASKECDKPMDSRAVSEVATAFLKLGVTSFGGPVAHIGYFRAEFVRRRAWLNDQAFADLVGLCQFLPGPASSQTAMALGYLRAGPAGAAAAWVAFTTPSALLMIAFAAALTSGAAIFNGPAAVAAVHGLKLVAVPIVAQAVWSMARTLCPDLTRAALAIFCAALMLFIPSGFAQMLAIAIGAMAGAALIRETKDAGGAPPLAISRTAGFICLGAFTALLIILPLARPLSPLFALADALYRSGALVFGGGHVVLPLLREAVVTPGWLSDETFLAGYGAAQAVPGPLLSIGAYIGMMVRPGGGWAGALVGIVMIFLPGVLILFGALPFWARLQTYARARAAMAGINAAVVGILAAALYTPVAVTAIASWSDAVIAALALLLLQRAAPIIVVMAVVAAVMAVRGLGLG